MKEPDEEQELQQFPVVEMQQGDVNIYDRYDAEKLLENLDMSNEEKITRVKGFNSTLGRMKSKVEDPQEIIDLQDKIEMFSGN